MPGTWELCEYNWWYMNVRNLCNHCLLSNFLPLCMFFQPQFPVRMLALVWCSKCHTNVMHKFVLLLDNRRQDLVFQGVSRHRCVIARHASIQKKHENFVFAWVFRCLQSSERCSCKNFFETLLNFFHAGCFCSGRTQMHVDPHKELFDWRRQDQSQGFLRHHCVFSGICLFG